MNNNENNRQQYVYQFRVFVQKVSPVIWRRLILRGDQTLSVFHETLQIIFGWSDEFLHRFQIRGRTYAVPRLWGIEYTKSAEKVTLQSLNLHLRERFLYEYNFLDWWRVEIRLEKILAIDDAQYYPYCINGSQAGPLEDCGGPNAYLRLRTTSYDPLSLILRFQEMADEYQDDREYGRWIRETFPNLGYWLKVHHFDRDDANQQLQQLSITGVEHENHDASDSYPRG